MQLKDMGLFKSQGLIGDKWADAEDGRTLPVCADSFSHGLCLRFLCLPLLFLMTHRNFLLSFSPSMGSGSLMERPRGPPYLDRALQCRYKFSMRISLKRNKITET